MTTLSKFGKPLGRPPLYGPPELCSVDGCWRPLKGNGLCGAHYMSVRRFGNVDGYRRPARQELFEAKVAFRVGGCWEWTAGRRADGYGWFNAGSKPDRAHRVAYQFYRGPIPEGLQIDHLCRNRSCVNPAHLEPVTFAENVRRGFVARYPEKATA